MPYFVRHKIVVQYQAAGATTASPHTFWFLAPDKNYDSTLTAAMTGVTKIAANAEGIDAEAPLTTVEALLKSGFAVRKVISYKSGTRRKYVKIIVAKDLADTFAPPENFKGDPNPKVVTPLDAIFS